MSSGEDKFTPGTRRCPQVLTVGDLFPAYRHRYLSDGDIERLRQLALTGEDVVMPALTAMEIVCDLVNGNAIEHVTTALERSDHAEDADLFRKVVVA